jgi:hypothetical protein
MVVDNRQICASMRAAADQQIVVGDIVVNGGNCKQ